MTHWEEGEINESLVEHQLAPHSLQVKLDRGFAHGTYGVCIEFDSLAALVGFTEARRQARAYGRLLRRHLQEAHSLTVDAIDDASSDGGPRRRADLESTYLTFNLAPDDGQWHDNYVTTTFGHALLRADQQWDQQQARWDARQRDRRREKFRERLDTLLEGKPYQHIDRATKERLHSEVTALVFPAQERKR